METTGTPDKQKPKSLPNSPPVKRQAPKLGAHYTVIIIRNPPKNSIGTYLGPCINTGFFDLLYMTMHQAALTNEKPEPCSHSAKPISSLDPKLYAKPEHTLCRPYKDPWRRSMIP